MAPANQLRLSFTSSEDGEAETEPCRVAKPRWRTTTRTSSPLWALLTEPPYADPHVRWCGRGGAARLPPIPIDRAEGNSWVNGTEAKAAAVSFQVPLVLDLARSIRIAERPQTSPFQPQALHQASSIRVLTSSSDRTMSDAKWAKASCLPQFKHRNVRTYLRVSSPTSVPKLGRFLF